MGLNEVLPQARTVSPGLICVDRTIQGPNENYQTPEQSVPKTQLKHPWESCMTLGTDWGWTPDPRFKTARRVIGTLAEITAKGGCLALGVGPTPDGLIEDKAIVILPGGGACAIQAMCTADGFCFQISSFRARLNTLDGENIDGGVTPDIPIANDGTVEVKVSEENSMTVKDYSKYFDIDYLRSLLESR